MRREPLVRSYRIFLVGFLALTLLLGGCGTAQVVIHQPTKSIKNYPRSVAILPFGLSQKAEFEEEPQKIFRKVFYDYFCYLGYDDMTLEEVDSRLEHFKIEQKDIPDISFEKWKTILGVDAVIKGYVLDANNFTGGIHAETTIKAKLEMLDLRTGETLWDVDHNEMSYSGIAIPSVVTMVKGQMANSDAQLSFYKTAESFSMQAIKGIPDPSGTKNFRAVLPLITRIESDLKSGHPLHPGETIHVSLFGQPGMHASFDIGSWRSGIAMKEISRGVYEGEYKLLPEDEIKNAFIIGTLRNEKGVTGKKFYKQALVTIQDEES
jgi:hypothetical protein